MKFRLPAHTVELTPTQTKRLFGKNPRLNQIACGTRGCAYRVGNHVVKITDDVDDAVALKRAQGLKHVATVKGVYRLPDAGTTNRGNKTDLYAIVMEHMPRFLTRNQDGWLDDMWFDSELRERASTAHLEHAPLKLRRQALEAYIETTCKGDKDCLKTKREFVATVDELYKRGIYWVDVGGTNVLATKSGVWKIVDLGHSRVDNKEPITPLAGYVRRKKR